MEENQKPDQPLNPHLAGLIGQFVMSQEDEARFKRAWKTLTGSTKRRFVSAGALSVLVLASGLTFTAYNSSLTLGKVHVAQSIVDPGAGDIALGKQFTQQASGYKFALAYPDGSSKSYSLADAGISVNEQGSVTQMRQATRHLGWSRFAWWKTTSVPLTITKNPAKFDAFIASSVAINNTPAKDASLAVTAGKAVVSDGENGSTYQIAGGNKQLASAASSLTKLSAKLTPTSVAPSIQKKDLAPAAQKVNDYTSHSVSFVVGDKTITASPSDIGNWLDLEPVPAKKTVDVTVNSGKIQAYVDKATASSIYVAKAQVTSTDSAGNVTVLSAGRDGSAIANKALVVKNVTNQLQQKDSVITANLEVTHDSFKTINAADYPKWLVADVTTKRMYAYEHNQLVRTFLISGGAPKTPTVLGTYQIYSKLPIRTMRGANADGSRYVQPDVKYVNYFYKDYAVHGNYWRPTSVFGNVNTSHGCIGITDSDAEWIYNWAPIGTTVITHD